MNDYIGKVMSLASQMRMHGDSITDVAKRNRSMKISIQSLEEFLTTCHMVAASRVYDPYTLICNLHSME